MAFVFITELESILRLHASRKSEDFDAVVGC
jgi:hypothetical protein